VTSNDKDLLRRFKPQLLYDSSEAFFADSPAEWTDNPANVLRRRNPDGTPGAVIAAANPAAGQEELSLEFLGGTEYRDGTSVSQTDFIACAAHDYRAQFERLHPEPEYRNRIYGRLKRDEGRVWLQYWFYYFFNDYNLAGGFGLHECDWEMIELLMKEDGSEPERAVYAQHTQAEVRDWRYVERLDTEGARETPLVYVARGSHASYFEEGLHRVGPVWWDIADGERDTPQLTLEFLDDEDLPSWGRWPGVWGDTMPRVPGLEQPSPPGPCRHSQWDHPAGLVKGAKQQPDRHSPPAAPPVMPSRKRGRLELDYDFSAYGEGPERPERLIVTVNKQQSKDAQRREPPRTYTLAVEGTMTGHIQLRQELDGDHAYDVRVSMTTPGGKPTAAAKHKLVAPQPTQALARTWSHALEAIGSAWRRLRGR
jgi:hypothetical protein